ncbi:MAG: glycosyltransferase [Chitinivibrionales bacterium]|nr:glycosyltransferase [Chitinivibrionales bacterium]
MTEITAGIKSFMRPNICMNTIQYALDAGVDRVLVGCDGPNRFKKIHKKMIQKFDDRVELFLYPFNLGLSETRNRLVSETDSKYFFLLDDDYYIPKCALKGIDFLKRHPDIKIVGFPNFRGIKAGKQHNWCFNMEIKDRKLYIKAPKDLNEDCIDGKYHFGYNVDVVENCAIMETKVLKEMKWDKKYIIGQEHEDFYLNMKYNYPQYKAGVCFNIFAGHDRGEDDLNWDNYSHFRYGDEVEKSKEYFYKKWNITEYVDRGNMDLHKTYLIDRKFKIYTIDRCSHLKWKGWQGW